MTADNSRVSWVIPRRLPLRSENQAMARGPTNPAPCMSVKSSPPPDALTPYWAMKKGTR